MESEYDRKFEEMKKYIPFLESMIKRLESNSSSSANPRQAQLDKIRSLRDLLLDKKKRMKMENLLKCEQVLVNLYAKVEQKDSFPVIKSSADMDITSPNEKVALETVRNKLKSVVKIQEGVETLPEIARANDIELHYTGSKEPALFQRRPNKSSKSPTHSVQKNSNESKTKSPQSQHKRSYTRVLVSPDHSPRRWSDQSSSDKSLFSRRSPLRTHTPPGTKKEKKKSSKVSKSRKPKDLNITLNVPEESLNSLNTKDILSRIINCSDGDVDIDTLRELRSQILGELKQTGKNDDISDLILKSYNKNSNSKSKTRRKNLKEDVEEGELSDSESEAIESIYGSLVVMDKDKKSLNEVKTIEDKDNQQRKIQICLVINSDKNETIKASEQSAQTIDLSEFEMLSENESDKSKEVISIDSDTSSPKKSSNKQKCIDENNTAKKKIDELPHVKNISEFITVEDENKEVTEQATEAQKLEETDTKISDESKEISIKNINKKDMPINTNFTIDAMSHKVSNKTPIEKDTHALNEPNLDQNTNTEEIKENSVQPSKFIANFYKPIGEQPQKTLPTTSGISSNNPEVVSVPNDCKNAASEKTLSAEVSTSTEKCEDDSQKIPLLHEPTAPPKAKTDVLSEIDILQALKNEILSDTIAMPGSETSTPALHQPKLTKVASVQEMIPKKRISIEKYKEKATTSRSKPLFVRKRNKLSKEDNSKKQSLMLTEKECERFNFPKRLSLDNDDDVDDLSDEEFLTEDKEDSSGLDDIYGDLAPKSPDNEVSNEINSPPVIIPTDPVKAPVVTSKTDVDMRTLPVLSSQSQSHLGLGAGISPSPVYGDVQNIETNVEQGKKIADKSRISAVDPRIRRDTAKNSPNSYAGTNPERTARSTSFSNVVTNAPGMTPGRTSNMTPSMTPSYMPSIPLLMTPNARSFEMTPSHQSFELEESSTRKHVYAPSFSICDNREREVSVSKDLPHWEMNRNDPRSGRRSRWEDSSIPKGGPNWEDHNASNYSGQVDVPTTPRYEDSYKPKHDRYNNRVRADNYNADRRDSYSKSDCPTTPIPSFGWSDCPSTPSSAFGRQEGPMTPSHPFGRSECPTTPVHAFGRADCLPSGSAFGHSFGRLECPSTPIHPFGRSECPLTPSHSFGRNDCPQTPSHPFGRSEVPFSKQDVSNSSNNQKYTKDPRLNRRPTEHEFGFYSERDYQNERSRKNSSIKPQSKHYGDHERNFEREKSVGRNDRNYSGDRGVRPYDRDRREPSGRLTLKDGESDRLYTRSRENHVMHSRNFEDFRRDQRDKSVGRLSENKRNFEETRSRSRASSVSKSFGREPNNDKISFKTDAGRNFTINTSVKSTFQDFLTRPIQVFDYSFDARKRRATSVGRSLVRENSISRTLSTEPKSNEMSAYATNRKDRFKRASSVGRELAYTGKYAKSLLEVKADFEAFRSKLTTNKVDKDKKHTNKVEAKEENTDKGIKKDKNQVNPYRRQDTDTVHQEQKSSQTKQPYSPKKNYRDPRMRKETAEENKNRYKLDRRRDLHNSQKSGIIYSSDNIAKGTIMGSGFGVKNYKIPKIKRAVVESEVTNQEKPELIEKCETKEKQEINESENLQKTKPKHTKEIIQQIEEPLPKIKIKKQPVSNKLSNIVDDSEQRVTRSRKKLNIVQSRKADSAIKNRKSKKSVIYDSESDSEPEIEKTENNTAKDSRSQQKTTNKKANTKTLSPVIQKEVKKLNDGLMNSNFGIDDMEMFSENIGSDPVIENINALIADLDNDLDSSKISNESFTAEIGNMMETINSPEGNSLGDISEVIEKDLNESNEILQQKIIADNLLNDKKQQINETSTTLQEVKPLTELNTNLDDSQGTNQVTELSEDSAIEKPVTRDISFGRSDITKSFLDDTALLKVNEAIVSTTEDEQYSKENENNIKMSVIENTVNNDDRSIPDSTIHKNISDKKDGIPDSTNEVHCELSSDVTSTFNTFETSKTESDIQGSAQKEPINTIGTLLSMLQDKTKIKELLSMLGDESGDTEKIKKKLEKLSEIVSDEEDENEEQKKGNYEKEVLPSSQIEEKIIDNTDISKNIQQSNKQDEINQKSDEALQTPNIDEKTQTDNQFREDVHKKNNENSEVLEGTDQKVFDKVDITNLNSPADEEKIEKEKTSEEANKIIVEKANDINKVDDDEQDRKDRNNKPLIKKGTKKFKGKKFKSSLNKNKPATRAANSQIKKPIKRRSRELQLLQEDIKEMFMSDDILNATGIRMCRLAKMVTEKESLSSGPVVVLEKVREVQNQDQPLKIRKKPGPKPKNKGVLKSADNDQVSFKRVKSPEADVKMDKPKNVPKYKPGPKSKIKQKSEDTDPYEFETDSVTDTNTTKESGDSSDSENESLASSHSFGSSEILAENKKKPKSKRRAVRGWYSGFIKSKNRKKKEQKQESLSEDSLIVKPQKTVTVPDLNCFTDKTYCFQKGVTTYDCRLCVYSGTDIVNHYKKQHPHTEIPLSRMDPLTAEIAIQQCDEINFQAISKIPSEKYTCRFCCKEFGSSRTALETFFWHIVSNHTGEFKHLCSECVNVTRCPFNLDIPPPPKDGGQLIGYICGKCNFTQISLENLKTHVIVRHNDNQTEVYTINLAVMSKKAVRSMLRRIQVKQPRVLRSLRSNRSSANYQDDQSEASDVSSDPNSDHTASLQGTENHEEEVERKPNPEQMKAKLTFENDEPSDETSIKVEQEEHDTEDRDDSSHFDDTINGETVETNNVVEPSRGNEIVSYPHFKQNHTDSGAREYVCCINGNDNHYKTSLLISMKKHIQSKHPEKWDGYCCICKVIVTLQGVQSDFKDCLSHFLDKHMDNFPVLEKVVESVTEERPPIPDLPMTETAVPDVASAVPVLPPAIPARVATPPVERTASPSYIAVRPLAELISKELVKELETSTKDTPIPFPKIENVVSLGETAVAPPQPSPVYPTAAESASQPDKPYLYEDVQAEVMSKKHRVVLDGMMSKENLVRVFKCAGRFCSFTTDSAEDALLHASTHQRVGGQGALDCAYCNYDACENGIDLVMHVFKEHSRCQYCCPLCFYRAAASQLVGAHYKKAHGGAMNLKTVLRSTAAVAPLATESFTDILSREVAVQHFICSHDENTCNFKTYTPGKFTEHLQQRHADAQFHPCNLCSSTFTSPTELVGHLKTHGLKLYQCTWCVFGANNEQEFLSHVASRHPDRQPQAYVRVITNKDGGQQRVLPLAFLNKSKVPTEDVTPNSTKENPVREAERSIELEKLIGHTLLMLEASTSQSPASLITTAGNVNEEPMELPPENFPEDSSDDESSAHEMMSTEKAIDETSKTTLETLLTSKSEKSINLQKSQEEALSVVKSEPDEVLKDVIDTDIICLDSDDEESNTMTEKTLENTSNDDTKTSVTEEVALRRVSEEVSRSSVTEEVSITRIINESTRKSISDDDSGQNVIDLSDDDPVPVDNTAKPDVALTVKQECIFKCPKCFVVCKAAHGLRKHVKKCTFVNDSPCPHKPCTAVLKNINKLIEHYFMVHKEFNQNNTTPMQHFCGICNNSYSSLNGAKIHIKAVHGVKKYSVTMTTDEKGNRKSVIQSMIDDATESPRISARKTSTEIKRYGLEPPPPSGRARKTSTEIKKRYGVEDIDKLPITPILDTLVYCELCEFGTKVRLNMVRHLQQHAGSMPVPHTAPVNPVPHLETNEKHFDKMVNLASSSAAARAPEKPPRPDAEPTVTLMIPHGESARYPRYVPERQRFTCGAKGCSYISVDMAMFRFHWETLHAGDDEYRCVHCPPHQALDTSIPLTAARILAHLRMHDISLYACSACSYYHYRKHLVEKHLSEMHRDASVKVVREEYTSAPATPPPTVGAPTMDLKAWQCGLCKFTSMLRPEVVNHCSSKHHSKMQFKCAYCPFRTSTKENVVKHQTNTHPTKVEEIFYYFYREGSVPDEADGTPRWQKQRQKLGLEEPEVKTEPEPAESAPEQSATLTPITTPITIDLKLVKKEVAEERSPGTEMSLDDLHKKFGQFCEPDGLKYKCCLCGVVREHSREAIQCHLYEELNYRRWECVTCSYKAFHKNGLNEHMASEHSRQMTQPRALPIDVNIEKWVLALLEYQTSIIEKNIQNLAVQKIQGERTPAAPVSPKKPESPKPALSASDTELQQAFGEFGTPKNQQFSCPKCDFLAKDEKDMVLHLESELTKIRWGCTNCSGKYQTFHEAQFHCKSAHTGLQARPKESVRDPVLRSGWVAAVVTSQRQFMKCISETTPDSPEQNPEEDSDPNENSLLVARYDEPVHTEEHLSVPAKRPAPSPDSDEERLVIDEPQKKKLSDRQCPYCDFVTTTQRYVREHILRHFQMKPYKCGYCPFDGCRQTVMNHLDKQHPQLYKRVLPVPIPDGSPKDITLRSRREPKEPDDVAKVVCLYCEKSVPETEVESHAHGDEKPEFAKRGEVVVKCCNCLTLRLTLASLQEHFDASHPSERLNYAYFKLQVDKREIHCCGHCYKKFKFLRDLKAHHMGIHTSLSLSYTSIPFNHNLHTEGDPETSKRKMEDAAGPPTKRVARKSTSKLPNSAVAKKSTTKLPFSHVEEYSYYGTRPLPFDRYEGVTVMMPMYNTVVQIDVKKLSGILKIDPKVVVKDYRS